MNPDPNANPFSARALAAAAETDHHIPLDQELMQLVGKTLPQPADRLALRELIEKIEQTQSSHRRTAAILEGVKNNSELIFVLLKKIMRYL